MAALKSLVAAFAASVALFAGNASHAGQEAGRQNEYNPVRALLSYFGGLDEIRNDKALPGFCDGAAAGFGDVSGWIEDESKREGMLTAYLCNAAGHQAFNSVAYNGAMSKPPAGMTGEQVSGIIYIAVDEKLEAECHQHVRDKSRPSYITTLCKAAGYSGYQKTGHH